MPEPHYKLIARQVNDLAILESLKEQFSPEQYQRMRDEMIKAQDPNYDDSREGAMTSEGGVPILFEMALISPDGKIVGQYYGVEAGYNGGMPVFERNFKGLSDEISAEEGILASFKIHSPKSYIENDQIGNLYSIEKNYGYIIKLYTPDNIPGSWGIRESGSPYENNSAGSIAIHPAADTKMDTDELPNDGSNGCFSLLVDPNRPMDSIYSDAKRFLDD